MTYRRLVDYRWSYREANTKEYTHCYHTYPAMMIPQVARGLIEEYKPQGNLNLLLDPYMGSGTSLVEASIRGVDCVGTDINPLARFMSEVKTTHYDESKVEKAFNKIIEGITNYREDLVKNNDFARISNYTFWYRNEDLLKLSYLSQLVNELPSEILSFFNLIVAELVREVSFTRNGEFKRFKMPEKALEKFNPDVFRMFAEKYKRNYEGLKAYNSNPYRCKVQICDFNSIRPIPSNIIKPNSVDMVVTSPPYGDSHTTVAYGQFSRWANEWFNFENAKNLDNFLMGGTKAKEEQYVTKSIKEELDEIKALDSKRYLEVVSFLNDYNNSICNVSNVVRQGGVICYVVGNRTVKGVQIPLDYFTAEMFEKNGFEHNITIVREIPNKRMPSKTSPTNEAGKKVNTMSNEYLVIMTKTY